MPASLAPDAPPGDAVGRPDDAPGYDTSRERYAGISSGALDHIDGVRAARNFAEMIVDTVREGLLVLDLDLRVKAANESFYEMFEWAPGETVGRLVYKLGNGQWDIEELRALLEDILPHEKVLNGYEVHHDFEEIGERVMLLNARQLDDHELILLAIEDVTEQKRTENALRTGEERYRALFDAMTEGFCIFEMIYDDEGYPVDYRFLDANPAFERHTGLADAVGKTARELVPDLEDRWPERYGRVAATGEPAHFVMGSDAMGRWFEVEAFRIGIPAEHKVALLFTDVTEHTLAEAALRQSEARLRLAQRAAGVGTFEWNVQANVNHWSPELEQLYSLPEGGFDGTYEAWAALVHPDDLPEAERQVQAALASGGFHAEWRVPRPDAEPLWILARGWVEMDEHGQPLRMIGANVDITARKLAEAALRQSEARYRLLVESAREYAMFMLDTEGRITAWNTGAERLFGYAEAEVLGQHGGLVLPEEDRAQGAFEAELDAAAREGQVVDDRWLVRQDGTRFWGTGVIEALRSPDGTPRGFAKVLRDNTRRMEAYEALRQSEERFRVMAEAVPDVLFTTTPEGTLGYVSRQYEALTGVAPAAVLGTPMWPDLVHPEDRARVEGAWAEALAARREFEARYRLRGQDTYCWVIARARPILDHAGALVRWFGTLTDIDALTQAEEEVRLLNKELRALNASLEARVEERTRQVRTLASRLTMAEQQERRRIAQVLHDDLQQLLYGVTMKLGLLQRALEEDERSGLGASLAQSRRWLDRAGQLTRELTVDLSPPVLDREGLAGALAWLRTTMAQLHGLEVTVEAEERFDLDDDLRVLLFQVVRELLFNVRKHAGVDEATVRLTAQAPAEASAKGERWLLLEVLDEGQGFDVATLDEEGNGFGLFSARERIRLLDGHVEVTSEGGVGTRVAVYVPLADHTTKRAG